jgi:hypothetical protein
MPRRTVPHTLRRRLGARVVPVHWTFLLGIVSAACFVVLVVTGVFLLLYYDSSSDQVVYHGSYVPLRGVEMSKALNSTLHISFEVRAGLLMRQAHHWAALILPASLTLQMLQHLLHRRLPAPTPAGPGCCCAGSLSSRWSVGGAATGCRTTCSLAPTATCLGLGGTTKSLRRSLR